MDSRAKRSLDWYNVHYLSCFCFCVCFAYASNFAHYISSLSSKEFKELIQTFGDDFTDDELESLAQSFSLRTEKSLKNTTEPNLKHQSSLEGNQIKHADSVDYSTIGSRVWAMQDTMCVNSAVSSSPKYKQFQVDELHRKFSAFVLKKYPKNMKRAFDSIQKCL